MGSILSPDKIGKLTKIGTTLYLDSLLASFGGRQKFGSGLSIVLGTMSANTLYFVYAVLNPSLQLVISTNVNSVGPAGFSQWKLVGAFYSNESSDFSTFVNIEGVPTTEWAAFTPIWTNDAGITWDTREAFYKRIGTEMRIELWATNSSNGSVAAALQVKVPIGKSAVSTAGTTGRALPAGQWFDASTATYNTLNFWLNAQVNIGFNKHNSGALSGNDFDTSDQLAFSLILPILGWTNTPLVDL